MHQKQLLLGASDTLEITAFLSPVIALIALALSILAFFHARRADSNAGVASLVQQITELRERVLSPDVRKARRIVAASPPIVRAAEDSYAPWSRSRAYLTNGNKNVEAALSVGGARTLGEFTDAYATLISLVYQLSSIAPVHSTRMLKKTWRQETKALYAHINEVLKGTDESRWELHKFPILWPLDQTTAFVEQGTLLSDDAILREIAKLNELSESTTAQLRLPTGGEAILRGALFLEANASTRGCGRRARRRHGTRAGRAWAQQHPSRPPSRANRSDVTYWCRSPYRCAATSSAHEGRETTPLLSGKRVRGQPLQAAG